MIGIVEVLLHCAAAPIHYSEPSSYPRLKPSAAPWISVPQKRMHLIDRTFPDLAASILSIRPRDSATYYLIRIALGMHAVDHHGLFLGRNCDGQLLGLLYTVFVDRRSHLSCEARA